MKNDKISVLMSTYKNDKIDYLKKAIDSMLNQTKKPSEIVIVIDGHIPNENWQFLKEYSKVFKIIKLVKLNKNNGLGLALKHGLLECSNKIVARMDSDDISRNDRLEKEYSILLNKKVDIVGSNISEFVENENQIISERCVPEFDEDIKKYMRTRCPMNHVTVMFLKDSVLKSGNYESLLYNEDYILWIKMFECGCKFYNIQENLVNVRVGKDMYKRRGGKRYFASEKSVQKYMLKKRIITKATYYSNLAKRFIVQIIMPSAIRQFIFQKFARSKPNEVKNEIKR